MKEKIKEKLKAIELRKRGYSVNEIIKKLGVAKGSVSVWVRNVELSKRARSRLLTRIKLGQLISAESKRKKTQEILDLYLKRAGNELSQKKFDKIYKKIICSLLYWCEGAKDHYGGVDFANSDSKLVKIFLKFFREGFNIDEEKFRVCLHLHKYHNPKKQLNFWSKVTDISKKQFIKPYFKPNTGKRIRENYPGCINIKYRNNNTARELLMTAQAFFKKFGGVV